MKVVNREQLLLALELVRPGLSERGETVDQSSCFVFRDGKVFTFNADVAVQFPTFLPTDLTAAVFFKPLLEQLKKLKCDEFAVGMEDDELVVKPEKSEEITFKAQKEILLPYDDIVDVPEKWRALPPDFIKAIDLAARCASQEGGGFDLSCVHMTRDCVESCDKFQALRFKLKLPVTDVMIPAGGVKSLVSVGVNEISVTDNWAHFRNANGLLLSCRRQIGQYPDLDKAGLFAVEGEKLALPKGLSECLDRASVFTEESDDLYKQATVVLRKNSFRLIGEGLHGGYKKRFSVTYNGPEMTFKVPPKILMDVSAKSEHCHVSDGLLVVEVANWIYSTRLEVPEVVA